jgi:Holliday junction resolvase-like predicted endonuclease
MEGMGTETEAQRKGRLAEERAAEYLRALGYSIVARNWRARRAEETVGWAKRLRLLSAARSFALSRAYEGPSRFDVVAYDGLTLRHLRDAFRAG